MLNVKPAKAGDDDTTIAVEGEIREFVRRDLGRKVQSSSDDTIAENLNTLLDRAGRNSAKEIDGLIADLQQIRDFLRSEGDRVQREITKYVQVSQTAMASVKIISEGMGQWKEGVANIRGEANLNVRAER
jgi:hypothetical protein